MNNLKLLNQISNKVRYEIIKQSFLKKSGHLGGSLSCADIVVNIFNRFIFKKKQDTFILSKGHCALTLYSVLFQAKKLSKKSFDSFANRGSFFGEHPSPKIKNKYINFSTGSLGHGLSFASGIAFSRILKKKPGYIFVLMSDGEMNSGTVWEAAMLASKLKLKNLVVIVDYNKFQATGKSNEILEIKPLDKKWRSFGWEVLECDGNKHGSLNTSIDRILKNIKKPKILISHTIKGKGVDFMENDNNWHYRSPTKEEVNNSKIQLGIK